MMSGSSESGITEEPVREFVLFTQPKTGTYLVSPLLAKMTGRKQHFANAEDFQYPSASETEEEFQMGLQTPEHVPVYMHHRTISSESMVLVLDRLKKEKSYYACHTPFSENMEAVLQKRDCIIFFIVRDPRSYIVSGARFYGSTDCCQFPKEWYQALSFKDQITIMIEGSDWSNSARWIISNFKNWVYSSNCCVIRYEDLLASSGRERQLGQLRLIANALRLEIDDGGLLSFLNLVFGGGPTFSGKSVSWKDVFTDHHKQLCKESIGDLLIELGYEDGYDW